MVCDNISVWIGSTAQQPVFLPKFDFGINTFNWAIFTRHHTVSSKGS